MKVKYILNPYIKVFRGYGATDQDKAVVFLSLFIPLMIAFIVWGGGGHYL